jgi:hypothetical protein
MAVSKLNPVSGGKTRRLLTLTSGTSWTVPAGVEFVNVTLRGAGGGGGGSSGQAMGGMAGGGAVISSIVTTTPGASITYAIGAGGVGGQTTNNFPGGTGGTTTFTGATSAVGGVGGATYNGNGYAPGAANPNAQYNHGVPAYSNGGNFIGGAGGLGSIDIEYWV